MAQPLKLHVTARYQNRLALGIFAAYLQLYPGTTLDDLRRRFPKREINENAGVDELFVPADRVDEHQRPMWKGYFVGDDELLTLADGSRVAVTSMWPASALRRLIHEVEPYGISAQISLARSGSHKTHLATVEWL